MIDEYNPLSKSFRKVRDMVKAGNAPSLALRFRKRANDSRMHNIPTADEVAGLIVGDFEDSDIGRDVIVHDTSLGFTRIHETHVLFLPLQYPLIFPLGENGWEPDIPHREIEDGQEKEKHDRTTIRRNSWHFTFKRERLSLATLFTPRGCFNNFW